MFLVSLLLSPAASAQDCSDIRSQLASASPQQIAGLYVQLASCDANTARRIAAATLPGVLSGDDGYEAIVAAVQVGAAEPAVTWIGNLQSDEHAKAIRALGEACQDSEPVQAFFIDQAATMGDAFWSERWYRPLGSCQVESIQSLLWSELDKGLDIGRSQFFGVLGTYARSAGVLALPKLQDLARRIDDAEVEANVISAFSDAAQVGSVDGMNQATAAKAARAIIELAPDLSIKGIEQARLTLQTLGAEAESDQLASFRYADARQEDGSFLWGVLVVEDASCKGGKKTMQRLNYSKVIGQGTTWADQLEDKVQASVEVGWELDLAARCKGEGELRIVVPDAPFADEAAYKTWMDAQLDDAASTTANKVIRLEQEPVAI